MVAKEETTLKGIFFALLAHKIKNNLNGNQSESYTRKQKLSLQCNLGLVTLNLVTTCDLVTTYFAKTIFQLLHKIIRFSESFCGDQKCH